MTSNLHKTPQASWRVGGKAVSTVQRVWTGYVLLIAFYAFVFSLWQVEPVPGNVHALGVLLAAICFYPIFLWSARGNRSTPAFELICVAYLLNYGVAVYLQKNQVIIFSQPSLFSWEETQRTMVLVCIGMVSFIISYFSVAQSKIKLGSLQLDLPLQPRKRLLFIRIAFISGFAILVLRGAGFDVSAGAFNSLVTAIQSLVYVGIVILGYRVSRGQESKAWTLVLYGAVALASVSGLMTGMLENAIVPVMLLVIVRWNVSRRVPIAILAGGLCVFIILNSVKAAYRSQTWTKDGNVAATDRLSAWWSLLQGTDAASQDSFHDTFLKSMSRFDLLHTFVRVQQFTPDTVPFYEGRTYGYMVYGWIPRIFWPDKPSAQEANVMFAVDYRFLAPEQTSESMTGIGVLPESFANFGVGGIVVIMALQGIFLALTAKMLDGPRSEGGKAIYLTVTIFFLNGIGSATAGLFMSIPLSILTVGVILCFFSTGWSANRVPLHSLSN